MKVLGIDPGTNRTGWALYDSTADRVLGCGAMSLYGGSADDRLLCVPELLERMIPSEGDIDLVAYEMMFSKLNNADGPLKVFAWMIRCRANQVGKAWRELPHATVYKLAIGKGNAKKPEVQRVLEERFCTVFTFDDESDALAIAIAGAANHDDASPRGRGRAARPAAGGAQ